MKIGDLSRTTGLTAYTIRYYERIGLLPRAAREGSSHRAYNQSILPWIAFLGRLKTTGMPIREMVRYAALRDQGTATEAERCELLIKHRTRVRSHLADLQLSLSSLDAKIAGYKNQTRKDKNNADGSDH